MTSATRRDRLDVDPLLDRVLTQPKRVSRFDELISWFFHASLPLTIDEPFTATYKFA